MKIGPFNLSLARPDKGELGASGTEVSTSGIKPGVGVVTQVDYVPELRGENLYREYDKMRKSDSQIKGALAAIKLPLLAADWFLEPPPEASPKEQEATDFLSSQLFPKEARQSIRSEGWRYRLRHILLHLEFGSMPMEKVWDIKELGGGPMVTLTKLAPRLPRTVTEWNVDEHGEFKGIVQQASKPNGSYQHVFIPAEKLLLFVNELEGADYRGLSILRAARKDWYYKDRLQRINAITLEKRGAGIDVGTITGGDEAQKRSAEDVLMQVRTHERAYVLETEKFKYRQEGLGSGGTLSPLESIKYHDSMILQGLLLAFLGMGNGDGGSYAMHSDKTTFYLMALLGMSEEIREPFNTDLLPEWTAYNFGEGVRPPTLNHSRLDRRDVEKVVNALKQLVPEGIITLDPSIEVSIRELLELPELQEPEAEASWKAVQARQIASMAAELERKGFDPAGVRVPYITEMAGAMGSYAKAKKHADALLETLRAIAPVRDAKAIRYGLLSVGEKAYGSIY